MKSSKKRKTARTKNKIRPAKMARIHEHVKQLIALLSMQQAVTHNLEREINNP